MSLVLQISYILIIIRAYETITYLRLETGGSPKENNIRDAIEYSSNKT